jgi:hypothetical protein
MNSYKLIAESTSHVDRPAETSSDQQAETETPVVISVGEVLLGSRAAAAKPMTRGWWRSVLRIFTYDFTMLRPQSYIETARMNREMNRL